MRIGFVVADCPTGEVVVGQWADDELRSRLRAHLTGPALSPPIPPLRFWRGLSLEAHGG